MQDLALLRLLQLCDSAAPIGSAAHSFGLETMVQAGAVRPADLERFLLGQLAESLELEAVFCGAVWERDAPQIDQLNRLLTARKPARESRQASLAMGRRFWRLFAGVFDGEIPDVDPAAMHHAVAFGAAARLVGIPRPTAIAAFLQQAVTAAISAAIRLMPLGQTAAQSLLWRLGPEIQATAQRACSLDATLAPCFAPALEIASMRHPAIETRLFIS